MEIRGSALHLKPHNLLWDGCDGGDLVPAYAHVKEKGLETEKDYPYVSGDGEEYGGMGLDWWWTACSRRVALGMHLILR